MDNADFADLIVESQDIWDQNARWWDAWMGEGNDWHRMLIAPAVEELLGVQPGERVLELACGNGQFARRLVSMGARVLACDSSAAFLDCARLRTNEYSERIEYQMIDLTSEEQLAALGTCEFDAAVCNMALANRAAAFAKAPEPGLLGGIIPVAYNRIAMLTGYISPDQHFITCPNQDVAYGASPHGNGS
jgi:SAM-dependent methyltransferase